MALSTLITHRTTSLMARGNQRSRCTNPSRCSQTNQTSFPTLKNGQISHFHIIPRHRSKNKDKPNKSKIFTFQRPRNGAQTGPKPKVPGWARARGRIGPCGRGTTENRNRSWLVRPTPARSHTKGTHSFKLNPNHDQIIEGREQPQTPQRTSKTFSGPGRQPWPNHGAKPTTLAKGDSSLPAKPQRLGGAEPGGVRGLKGVCGGI